MDVENTTPEAFAKLMAEETDGLVLGSLPYFFCGASPISRGTIQMSVEQGLPYLKAIAHLAAQPGLPPSGLPVAARPGVPHRRARWWSISSTRRNAPISYIDLGNGIEYSMKKENADVSKINFDDIFFGAYEIVNRKDELVIDPAIDAAPKTSSPRAPVTKATCSAAHPLRLRRLYFARPEDHAGMTGACKTVEERDERLRPRRGEMIRRIVKNMDMPLYVKKLREMDEQHQNIILLRYADVLPRQHVSQPRLPEVKFRQKKRSRAPALRGAFCFVPLALEDQSSKSWGQNPSSSIFSP